MTKNNRYIIADTSGIYSLLNEKDRNQQAALDKLRSLKGQSISILVPWDILVETINTVGKKNGHAQALAVAEYLNTTDPFVISPLTERSVFESALDRFSTEPQSVSFTDCVVMAIADFYETKDIFGFDEAFAQNGYRIVG